MPRTHPIVKQDRIAEVEVGRVVGLAKQRAEGEVEKPLYRVRQSR